MNLKKIARMNRTTPIVEGSVTKELVTDQEIGASISSTFGFQAKDEPQGHVKLSEAQRAARREKNRASARKRLEPVLAAQKGKADWKARAKARRHGA